MMALVTSLWEKLETKYIQEDVTSKKFLVSKLIIAIFSHLKIFKF
uniref:Uncharacterized protein LOC105853099 n=1 Tax=Rhizophora mucronata TaxID=61149 RepID=A0A2P2JAX2_RHIMU